MLYFLTDTWVDLLREVFGTMWLWLPPLALIAFYQSFYSWRSLWFGKEKYRSGIFEIRLPKELTRSPKAMEMVLTALHITSAGLTNDVWIMGAYRPWSSLEVVSIGGDIHFYIVYPIKWKFLLQSQIYAHYPEVEIIDAEDYTAMIPYGLPGSDWNVWGGIYGFAKNKPEEAGYALKTYVDYGLDKDPKEEFKVDPMVPLLEFLGNADSNEQIWIQFVIRAAKLSEWQDPVRKLLERLTHRADEATEKINFAKQSLTPGEKNVIEGIERKLSKLCFYTGIRLIYMSREGKFRPENCLASLGIFRPMNSEDGQAIGFCKSTTYDQPWEDVAGLRAPLLRALFWREYRHRGWHYPPFKRPPMVMTTEELATIYHFPGSVASTPNLQRIGSKKAEAPVNLPT